jgi:hypothetical protein
VLKGHSELRAWQPSSITPPTPGTLEKSSSQSPIALLSLPKHSSSKADGAYAAVAGTEPAASCSEGGTGEGHAHAETSISPPSERGKQTSVTPLASMRQRVSAFFKTPKSVLAGLTQGHTKPCLSHGAAAVVCDVTAIVSPLAKSAVEGYDEKSPIANKASTPGSQEQEEHDEFEDTISALDCQQVPLPERAPTILMRTPMREVTLSQTKRR